MIFTEEMLNSMKKVEAARAANIALEPRRMTAEEKDNLLNQYHPDYAPIHSPVRQNIALHSPVYTHSCVPAHHQRL